MSLQVWLPLNGSLDNQGLSDLKFTATSYNSVDNNGKIGQCYKNDAPSWDRGKIISDKTIDLGSNQSMFCWVNFTTLYSGSNLGGGLVSQHNASNNSGMSINIKYVSATTGYATISTGNGSARSYVTYLGTTLLEAGKWYHLGYTYDGSTIKIYVNGICEKTQSYSGMYVPANNIGIFTWSLGSSNYCLNGKLNDVRVYDHCLSPKEVEEIAKGLVLHYKLDDRFCEATTNLFSGQTLSVSGLTVTTSGTYSNRILTVTTTGYIGSYTSSTFRISFPQSIVTNGTQYALQFKYKILSGSGDLNLSGCEWCDVVYPQIERKQWGDYYQVTCKCPVYNNYNSTYHFIDIAMTAPNTKIQFWDFQLEAKDHITPYTPSTRTPTTVYDSSGYSNNGTISGTLTAAAPSARYDVATYISSGNTDYITSPTMYLPGDKITMNFWFKSSNKSPGSGYHMPLEGNASSNQSYEMSITSSGVLRGGLVVAGSRKVDNCTSSKLTDGNWHMCTMTYDGATIKRYVDAVMEKSTAATGALVTSTSFVLGHYGSNTNYYSKEAYTSDVRIYTTALTENQIKELYTTSMSIDSNGNIHARELVEL